MEAGSVDAPAAQTEPGRLWPCSCSFFDGLCRRWGINGTKMKSYSLLSLILKSEALYMLYTCYISLLVASHPLGELSHPISYSDWIPYLWVSKPLMAMLDDSMDAILRGLSKVYRFVLGGSDAANTRSGRQRNCIDALADFNRSSNLLLVVCQVGIIVLTPSVMFYSYLHPLGTGWGPLLVVALSLCQVATAAVGEGIFCRYVQCNAELNEVQFASLRLLFVTGYGVWNMLSMFMPYPRTTDFWSSFVGLVNLLPCFLLGNSMCILWVLLCDPGGYEESVDASRRADTTWSPGLMCCFLNLMVMGLSARLPYDCLVMRASTYPPASLMLLVVLNVCTKVAVGCALARFVDLRRMILIAKLAFVFALTLLFAGDRLLPLPLADSSLPYLIFMGILMATLQQLIVTFGLVFTVRTAPSGMEAALTSLNDLTLDMICFSYKKSISLRSIASLYVPHSRMVDGLIVFFSLYSFFRVFGKAQEAAMLDRGSLDVISPASSSIQLPLPVKDFGISTNPLVGESLSEHSSSAVDRQDSLKGVGARKSPWAVESEYSDASS